MAGPTVYSHEATVAAITSFYTFISRIHSDEMGTLRHPPPTGWPQITRESYPGCTDTVIELLRHIPYFTDATCIMDVTESINFVEVCEFLAARSEEERKRNKVDIEKQSSMAHLITLANGRRDGYDITLDTERGVIIWEKKDWNPPEGIPWGDEDCYDADADPDGPDAWKTIPTFRVEAFFEMCKEQFRIMNWMPRLEDFGRGEIDQLVEHQKPDELQAKRMQILKDAGWPGDGEGGGWDKERAEREMQELRDSIS